MRSSARLIAARPRAARLFPCLLLLASASVLVLPCAARTSRTRHTAKHTAAKHSTAESCSSRKYAALPKAEMRQHIKSVAPLDPPPSAGKSLRLDGVATLHVAFGTSGRVDCVKVVRGEPKAAAAIAKSVKDWRFTPYRSGGHLKPASGDLSIKYHLRDQGSTAAVE